MQDRTPYALALRVKEDLEHLGYTGIIVDTSPPGDFYLTTEHKRIILLRTTINAGGDFHFMVFENVTGTAGDYYHHKPGKSIPLRLNSGISITDSWISEGCINNVCSTSSAPAYSSDIYYITFTIPCTTVKYTYSADGMHNKICRECEKSLGQAACTYVYKNNGSATHILTCSDCGHRTGSSLPCRYVDGRCRLCGGFEPIAMQLLKKSRTG